MLGRGDTRRPTAVAKRAAAFAQSGVWLFWMHRRSSEDTGSNFISQRAALLAVFTSLAAATCVGLGMATAEERPFNPIRSVSTAPTDRTLVDLEIVGSTSLVPEQHRLEPERVLRLRLERAYILTLLTKPQPGFELVNLRFDVKTGLPMSLFDMVALRGKFHEDIPGIPDLSQIESIERAFSITLTSEMSASILERGSVGISKCRGVERGDGLFAYDWNADKHCFFQSYTRGSQYVARYDDKMFLRIMCENSNYPIIDCELVFPFEKFGVQVSFNHVHLSKWSEVIDRSAEFLRSKQYR
jgi:hypothetical protein